MSLQGACCVMVCNLADLCSNAQWTKRVNFFWCLPLDLCISMSSPYNPPFPYNLKELTLHSPAKVNLMLSVHEPREDGFHALTSLVVALGFGDQLTVSMAEGVDSLHCSDAALTVGPDNLVLRAAHAFRVATGTEQFFAFSLEKRIPMGAGLGGGSGNASAALKAMNQLSGNPLSLTQLSVLSAELGSDCPFFIEQRPAVMSGRGEHIERLSDPMSQQLAGQRLVLFKPDFAVETRWAYTQLIDSAPDSYEAEQVGQSRLAAYQQAAAVGDLLYNSFEPVIGRKYIAIPALLEDLRARGVPCLMSGSGSCCFALESDTGPDFAEIKHLVSAAWGESVFFVETSILAGETNALSGGI